MYENTENCTAFNAISLRSPFVLKCSPKKLIYLKRVPTELRGKKSAYKPTFNSEGKCAEGME